MVIPFGIVGAVIGHWIMGMDLTLLSLMGVLALSGVVVNDSLVLVDFVNRKRGQGIALFDAVYMAGGRRFRPVLLTSLTTCVGLLPILINQSATAKYFHTTAATIIFGIAFASFWILIVIPVAVSLLEDMKNGLGRFFIKDY